MSNKTMTIVLIIGAVAVGYYFYSKKKAVPACMAAQLPVSGFKQGPTLCQLGIKC